jgi:hypothetical protein
VNNSSITNRAIEYSPSKPATVALIGDAICITAIDIVNDPSNSIKAIDDPTPDAVNNQAGRSNKAMVAGANEIDVANNQSNPIEAIDNPAIDVTKPNTKLKELGLTAEEEVRFLKSLI